jgi:hypothetical protein
VRGASGAQCIKEMLELADLFLGHLEDVPHDQLLDLGDVNATTPTTEFHPVEN